MARPKQHITHETTGARYASRGATKLAKALKEFGIDPTGMVCADLGSSTGGFVDCLLQHGAKKVYAIEIGYGVLDWKLRNDPRVVVMERTNAFHVKLPETINIVTIDSGWTKQEKIIPIAFALLKKGGVILSLIKPHYEANKTLLRKGKLPAEIVDKVVDTVVANLRQKLGDKIVIHSIITSPITGLKGKNIEYIMYAVKL